MEEKVNAIVDEILDEDEGNDFDATQSENCPRDCKEPDDTPKETSRRCKCGVENSTRFSLRVLEAMRSLQRDLDQPSTSSVDDIVDYIRANYRHDGDLYAQVRTVLRQVCSQGFVMELLGNEYHLIGPVVSSTKPNGCSWNCKGRTTVIDDTSRKWNGLDDRRNNECGCERFPRRNGPSRGSRFIVDRDKNSIGEPRFHSTEIAPDERNEFDTEEVLSSCDCNGTSDIRDDQRDITRIREIQRRDEQVEPVPGPSRDFVRLVSARNAKEARLEDRRVQRAIENDEDTTTKEEEDIDCACDTNGVTQVTRNEHSRRRPRDRVRVIKDQRNGRRRENGEEEEDEERVEEEDEDTEDSVYRELRARSPRRRTTARERELKRWIRRCRQECERRRRAR
ncbi:uncharacterized protein LOC114943477 [Nylanderia fulva]|uniref:uncharacterized protein LOC114943477 n=1 Tax=Nylanderia fulva TaxID=613905 RepID=UPI0010FB84DD|nr:uncharacterized protein LOC114943477 [Nylanderia fulva]